jgi:hypothetical protein
VNAEIVSHKKKGDYQSIMLNPGNKGTEYSQADDWGLRHLAPATSSQQLHSNFLFLSNIVYSKGEYMSYSASVGKI